jgi:signal transduction histidine kinase
MLRITDGGPGFAGNDALARSEANGHLGLSGMRERITALGGHVRVQSAAGSGVTIEIRVPITDGVEA